MVVRNAHFVAGTGIDIVIRALFDKEIVESFAVQAVHFKVFPVDIFRIRVAGILFQPRSGGTIVDRMPFAGD